MSGHSKWSTIKRKKALVDAKKGKIFTKIAREIMVAAKEGGGDPTGNPRLRLALAQARAANMPKDNQERAIKKGTGEGGSVVFESFLFEGRGPQGSCFMIEGLTDNRNRTVPEIRHMLSKAGGEMVTSGAVGWMFDRKGVIEIPKEIPKPAEPAPAPAPAPAPPPVTVVSRTPLEFPRQAAAEGIDAGRVKARVRIDAAGGVLGVQVLESRPPRVFDRAVVQNLSTWRFNAGADNRTYEVVLEFKR